MIAANCDRHQGLHHFSDMSIIEIVDGANRPVAAGTPGAKVLLTKLHKFVQPIIHCELTDILTQATRGCHCGRAFSRFAEIGGRTEDIFFLPAEAGGRVAVSPVTVGVCLVDFGDIAEYQYAFDETTFRLTVVPRRPVDEPKVLSTRLRQVLIRLIIDLGAMPPKLDIASVSHLPRTTATMGKLKIRQ